MDTLAAGVKLSHVLISEAKLGFALRVDLRDDAALKDFSNMRDPLIFGEAALNFDVAQKIDVIIPNRVALKIEADFFNREIVRFSHFFAISRMLVFRFADVGQVDLPQIETEY